MSAQNLEVRVIPDRIIEQGTLTTHEGRAAVEVRLPWYRALPGSCIAGATLTIDGVPAPADSLRWRMNDREFTFDELRTTIDEWWFPTDSAVLSGDVPAEADAEHEVSVGLTLYIPYIIISDTETLHIDESNTKTMKAVAA
ncbi:C-glycoside deglycosidase beta subunit domain-containing protein [Microbacterium sp.]|uniref:C-glycoside deglycosidase beta subunit domain-containing protein n=1 Tax=Microbacterium sp. TaxID=51671 RepID=UPI003F6FC2DB